MSRSSLISPVILDSTEVNFDIIDNPLSRLLISYDIDVARYNLSKFFNTNQLDLQIGLGYHNSHGVAGIDLPAAWNSQVSDQSNDEYQFRPSISIASINTSISFQPIEWIILSSYYSFGLGSITPVSYTHLTLPTILRV